MLASRSQAYPAGQTAISDWNVAMDRLQLTRFPALMALTEGRREVAVALVDGPVLLQHTDLANSTIKEVPAGARVDN